MDQLNRSQFILLVLLVTFVTSVATAIVTATLVNQAPSPITQTVNKIIEKTVETITLDGNGTGNGGESVTQVIITEEQLVSGLVEKVSSAVVSVVATKDLPIIEQVYINPFQSDPFFQQFFPQEFWQQFQTPQYQQKGTQETQISSGTGFFVSADGLLLTNKHVVSDTEASYSVILNDGRRLSAEVLARDPMQDVAVLKAKQEEGAKGFSFIPLGDSNNIKVGQTVIAIGNALGEFQNTVSKGIVSGLNRSITATVPGGGEPEHLQALIQTDAAVNPGNSGGPLLNLRGEVIGLNTALAEGAENLGFALPVNFAKKGIADVKEFGEIRYAFLGVRYIQINQAVKEEKKLSVDYGILVVKGPNGEAAVYANSPAAKAGISEGDIILEFGGTRLDTENTLMKLMADKRVGDSIALKVLSGDKTRDVNVTLDERPKTL